MRKPEILVVPFRFREGYPDEIVDDHINQCVSTLNDCEVNLDVTENVIFAKDADLVVRTYNPNKYDLLILLIPTWIEPVLVMRVVSQFKELPVIVWGAGTFIHEGKRVNLGSIPGSGVVKGSLREHGIYHEYIYSLPNDEKTKKEIKNRVNRLANVGRAISLLKETRIVTIGYLFGGMALGDMDLTKMKRVFGTEVVEFDAYTLIARMDEIDTSDEKFKKNVQKIEKSLGAPLHNKLEQIAKMYSVLKDIAEEQNAQALTVKCHFELSQQYGLTACIPLSVLGNEIVASCEADIPVVLTQLVLHYLSGGGITTYADMHEILSDRVLVAACGFAPGGMCIDEKVIPELPEEDPDGLGATFGDYITNKNYLREGLVTLARILKEPKGGFSLHIATGDSIGNIGQVCEIGCPQYPFTEIKLSTSVDEFAQQLGSHHYAIVYDDLVEDLKLFCKIKAFDCLIGSTKWESIGGEEIKSDPCSVF